MELNVLLQRLQLSQTVIQIICIDYNFYVNNQ